MNRRATKLGLLSISAAFTSFGCAYKVEKEPTLVQPSFQSIRSNVLEPRCAQCHSDWINNYQEVARLAEGIAQRISSTDQSFVMPPPGSAALTESERSALLQWIRMGAPEQPPPNRDNS